MDHFDEILSLGGSCEVAHNIREYYHTKKAYPFDWWIVPFDGTKKLLSERFSNLFRLENLEVMERKWAVRCSYYGIVHHHDFPRSTPSGPVIPDMIETTVIGLKEKYRTLYDRLDDLCSTSKRVLFIRAWLDVLHAPADYPRYMPSTMPCPDFIGLIRIIESTWPCLDFKVLFLNYGAHSVRNSRALFDNVEDGGDILSWRGSPKGWAAALDKFQLDR